MTESGTRSAPDVAPPANQYLVDYLRGYWAEVLELPLHDVHADTDLFAHGADSLDTVYLQTRLESYFLIDMPDHAAIEAPTPGEMAELVAECQARRASRAVAPDSLLIRITDSQPGYSPVLIAPGAPGRHPVNVAWLSRHIDSPRGVAGLVTIPSEMSETLPPSQWFDRTWRKWVDEVLAAYPTGPWRMVGICFGAPFIWEAANVLSAHGEVSLMLLDPWHRSALTRAERPREQAILDHQCTAGASFDLTLLLTPKWPFRANAMMYAELVNGETAVALLPERMALHAITAQSIGPVSLDI
ncbi:MAG: acyl carrier protein [Thermomicrobiales bacterium]